MQIIHHKLEFETADGINLIDITSDLRKLLAQSSMSNGIITITSRHTTTAITINENESRLLEDIQTYFSGLVPADAKYLHNDIHLRDCPPDEPENAHSHIIAMLFGSSETIPVVEGELELGTWQSAMLVELDGPRTRTVNVQLMGTR